MRYSVEPDLSATMSRVSRLQAIEGSGHKQPIIEGAPHYLSPAEPVTYSGVSQHILGQHGKTRPLVDPEEGAEGAGGWKRGLVAGGESRIALDTLLSLTLHCAIAAIAVVWRHQPFYLGAEEGKVWDL